METLKRARRPVKNGVNKRIGELEKLLKDKPLPKDRIAQVFGTLVQEQEDLIVLNHKILEAMAEEDVADLVVDTEYEEIQTLQQTINDLRSRVEKVLYAADPVPGGGGAAASVHGSECGGRGHGYKLPKIALQTFSGKLIDWLDYWAQFSKIDDDPSLHLTDKYNYLLQSLVEGTDAHAMANAYHKTGDCYPKAVEALKRRYGNEDLLLQVYIREILKLVISNVNSEEKLPLNMLHLKLESHLRALKTLKLENADPATWLYPLVESSLPEEILLTWQRSPLATHDGSNEDPPKNRLDLLMDFMDKEVEIQMKMNLAREGFGKDVKGPRDPKKNKSSQPTPTLASCQVVEIFACHFCEKNHDSKQCNTAKKWTLEKKRTLLKEKRVCFKCFKSGHLASACRVQVQCFICSGKHYPVMCPNNTKDEKKSEIKSEGPSSSRPVENMTGLVNQTCSKKVALQTLLVEAWNEDWSRSKSVRVFLDNGSQGSCILKSTAMELGLVMKKVETISHSLFGGTQTEDVDHDVFNLILRKPGSEYSCLVAVRDQGKICNLIPRVSDSSSAVMSELEEKGIQLSDVGEGCPPIEVLLGADVFGRLLTKEIEDLPSGLTAIGTKLGWTVCGKMEGVDEENLSMCVLSMAVTEASISQLWDLDLIGIRDETDVKSIADKEEEDKYKFFQELSRKEDGRYVVALPWVDCHPPLPSNYAVAQKRLQSTTKKLESQCLFNAYSKLFEEWKAEGFIEEVPINDDAHGRKVHYIPHRAVIKMSSSTTPVRPVFDASCKVGKSPSLNECLKKGSNFIQLIPEVLLRFRENKIGFVSDIRKAFQMIEVKEDDRDCMRFLWWKDSSKKELVEYRHVRVMFGANCSPFILGAVLEHHLRHVSEQDQVVAERLLQTLYVDNCASSESSVNEYLEFKKNSIRLLEDAGMDLRLWMSNVDEFSDPSTLTVPVLGVQWDRLKDELFVDVKNVKIPEVITKRTLLSVAQSVYDPLGIVSPAVIPVKIILQKLFIAKLKWDDPIPEVEKISFMDWISQLPLLTQVRVPRCFSEGNADRAKWTLHVFTDASGVAYGAVVFLRVEHDGHVSVQLVESRCRVAPIKKVTIPRLELLGCLIGARLASSIIGTLKLEGVPVIYWSDSTTALAWIKRDDQWGTYIGNRVKEIRKLTDPDSWRHVPGIMNPADLPSRGCTPHQLVEKKWWKGPQWLFSPSQDWPCQVDDVQEELVLAERRKSAKELECSSLSLLNGGTRSTSFRGAVRTMAWCHRFVWNCKSAQKQIGELTLEELKKGENSVIMMIQQDLDMKNGAFRKLDIMTDGGVIRVKTKIILGNFEESFRCPVVIPGDNPLVKALIMEMHVLFCHAGVGYLMTKLREKFWILKARKNIKNVINTCIRCRRLSAKPAGVIPSPLPVDRIDAARVFEVVGVDLAGPFHVKTGKKVWIVIFTCAVFRAVRLEIVKSLTTAAFVDTLKTFVRMNGRPRIIMSDNGTNFHGSNNFFKTLDWEEMKKFDQIEPIQWKFNVAAAPWWGGFWERLIRVMKDMMKRTIGNATLNQKELSETLIIVEEVMNGRPLTYVSEENGELEPLTPSMFMNTPGGLRFPEGCETEAEKISCRWKYLCTLKNELRMRFEKEYLALLVSRASEKSSPSIKVGDLVLIEIKNKKKVSWPLGCVLELFPGKDGVVRVAKVKTGTGTETKPVQLLYPLEINSDLIGSAKKFKSVVNPKK